MENKTAMDAHSKAYNKAQLEILNKVLYMIETSGLVFSTASGADFYNEVLTERNALTKKVIENEAL